MKLLLDANLSPSVAEALRESDFDAAHVADLGLLRASDEEIFDRAAQDAYVIVTADTYFGALHAMRRMDRPSVLQLRGVAELPPTAHIDLLIPNLRLVRHDLERGAIVSLSPTRLAVRNLPIG